MSDVAEFLLARIAEDEKFAQLVTRAGHRMTAALSGAELGGMAASARAVGADPDMAAAMDPFLRAASLPPNSLSRVLAECAAKRRIVAADWRGDDSGPAGLLREDVLRALALPYAGHPDYRPEWEAL